MDGSSNALGGDPYTLPHFSTGLVAASSDSLHTLLSVSRGLTNADPQDFYALQSLLRTSNVSERRGIIARFGRSMGMNGTNPDVIAYEMLNGSAQALINTHQVMLADILLSIAGPPSIRSIVELSMFNAWLSLVRSTTTAPAESAVNAGAQQQRTSPNLPACLLPQPQSLIPLNPSSFLLSHLPSTNFITSTPASILSSQQASTNLDTPVPASRGGITNLQPYSACAQPTSTATPPSPLLLTTSGASINTQRRPKPKPISQQAVGSKPTGVTKATTSLSTQGTQKKQRKSSLNLASLGPNAAPANKRWLCPENTSSTSPCYEVRGKRNDLVRHVKEKHSDFRAGWGKSLDDFDDCGPYSYPGLRQRGQTRAIQKRDDFEDEVAFPAKSKSKAKDEEEDISDTDSFVDHDPPAGRKDGGNDGNNGNNGNDGNDGCGSSYALGQIAPVG